MVDQNIINYLSEGLQEGHDIESLRKMLLEAGHDGSQVNQAIEIVNRAPKVNLGSSGKKSGSKRIIFLVVVILVVILVGAYFVFQPFSSDSDVSPQDSESTGGAQSQTQGKTAEPEEEMQPEKEEETIEAEGEESQTQEVVDCGEVPISFAKESGEDDTYFETHPEVKESFECLSDNFNACTPSRLKYTASVVVDELFIVNRSEGDNCVLQYVYDGKKGIECEYTSDQIEMTRLAAEEEGMPWADAFSTFAGMAFEIFSYSSGETFNKQIIDENGELEDIPCVYYPYANNGAEGDSSCTPETCFEGENCIDGQCVIQSICVDSDDGKDEYVYGELYKNGEVSEDKCAIPWGNNMRDAGGCPEWGDPNISTCFLGEKFCDGDEFEVEYIECPNGCARGVCTQ